MKANVVCAGLLMMCVTAAAQTTFSQHMTFVKQGRLGPRETAFAKSCGVDPTTAAVTYGEAYEETYKWVKIPKAGDGTNDAHEDSFGTAEIYSVGGKPVFVNIWQMVLDVGNAENDLFCLDGDGNVTLQETLTSFAPPDASPGGWFHLRTTKYAGAGAAHAESSRFVNAAGKPSRAPKMSKDDMSEALAFASPSMATAAIGELAGKAGS